VVIYDAEILFYIAKDKFVPALFHRLVIKKTVQK